MWYCIFQMSIRDNVLWHCNQVKHAQDYLLVIPISGINQTLRPRQFMSVLCYRLRIPFFAEDSHYTSCHREMDIYEDHALHCASEVELKFRHDLVRDIFVDTCFRAGVAASKEASFYIWWEHITTGTLVSLQLGECEGYLPRRHWCLSFHMWSSIFRTRPSYFQVSSSQAQ